MLAYECQKWGVDLELDVGLFVEEEKIFFGVANFGRVEAIDDFREYILISRDYIHCSRTSGHTFLQLFFLQSFEAKLVER